MSEDAFHRDDPTGVLLARAINHSHAAAPDFLQDFVMTKAPLLVGNVCFREDTFERFTGRLAFSFKSFAQETVNAGPVIDPGYRAALRAFRRMFAYVRDGVRGRGCFVHQAAAASAPHIQRLILIGDIVQKILERLEQERAEAAATLVGLPQPISFQNHQEKILRKILRVLTRIAAPADIRKNGTPISSAKLRQRFSSLLLIAIGIRPGKDETPAR